MNNFRTKESEPVTPDDSAKMENMPQGTLPAETLRSENASDPLKELGKWIGKDSSQNPLSYLEASNNQQSGE